MSNPALDEKKLSVVLEVIERMAGGDTDVRFDLSENRDSLDAICHGINVLVEELTYSKVEAEKANKIKSDFLATISHEIRTPVTAIKGFSELMAGTRFSKKEKDDAVKRILSNSSTLLALIDDLLDLSKVEAGKLPVEKLMLNPKDLVNEVLENLRASAKFKGLRLNVEFSSEVPEYIETDPLRLKQILSNVIGNAIKYTYQGGVDIWVDLLEVRDSNNKVLSIIVEDTGVGISPHIQEILFQPYVRGEGTLAKSSPGTGLGLVLSKRLAKLLGGDLKIVKSKTGAGSAFQISVDTGSLLEAVAMSITEKPRKLKSTSSVVTIGRKDLENVRILLAEDNEDLQALFKSLFEMAGAKVDIAENGERAVEMAKQGEHDVVLMDVTMPKLSGVEATRSLRMAGYKAPILALSAHAMKEHQAECLQAGYNDFVPKPVDIKTLFSKILLVVRR